MSTTGKEGPPSRYIALVYRVRLPILLAWIGMVAWSALTYLSAFRIDNSIATWFLETDSELAAYEPIHRAFGETDWLYLWIRTADPDDPEFLRELQLLGDRLQDLESVIEVLSLASFREIGALTEAMATRSEIGPAPLAAKFLSSSDPRYTIVAIHHADDLRTEIPYRIQLIDRIREAADLSPLIESSGLVGTGVINAELNRAARRDMVVYYSLITVFVFVAGGIALGHWRDLVILAAVVVGTIIPVMGAIAALGLSFNLITIMLPTLLVTVSVSYLVHFLSEFHLQRSAEPLSPSSPVPAISRTFARLLRPGVWTTLTTAIGFASLLLSSVAPVRQLGGFAALGIGVAWLNTISVAPVLLSLLWSGSRNKFPSRSGPEILSPLIRWLSRPHPRIATVLGLLLIGGTVGLHRLSADTDYLEFFRSGNRVRQDYAVMDRLNLPSDSLRLILELPKDSEIAQLDRHLAQVEFEKTLADLPRVREIDSLDQNVARLGSNLPIFQNPNFPDPRRLWLSQLGGKLDYVSRDGRKVQLRAMTSHLGTRDLQSLRKEIEGLPPPHSHANLRVTGTNVLWSNMDSHVIHTQLRSIACTALFLLCLLPFAFRSLALGAIGFAVSFVPVLCTLGLMGWLGLPVNIATCLLGGVVIGLAVDDTIYFLARFREGLLDYQSPALASKRAVETTGRAMIKTSFILIGGFLTMGASDFLPSVYFGLFFSFSLLVALLADLLILPVMLRWLLSSRRTSTPHGTRSEGSGTRT